MVISWKLGEKYYPVPYDLRKIFGYLGVSAGFSILAFYVFRENYLVNIPLLGLFGLFIYYNEKKTLDRIVKRPAK